MRLRPSTVVNAVLPAATYFLSGFLWTWIAQAPFLMATEDWSGPPLLVSRNVILSGGLPLVLGVVSGILFSGHGRNIRKGYPALIAGFLFLFAFAPIRHRWVWGNDQLIEGLILNGIRDLIIALPPVLMVGMASKLAVGLWSWKLVSFGVALLVVAGRVANEAVMLLIGNDRFPLLLVQPLVFGTWVGALAALTGVWIWWSTIQEAEAAAD